MNYKVKYEEIRAYVLSFKTVAEFQDWQNEGSRLNDLDEYQKKLSACNIEVTECDESTLSKFIDDVWKWYGPNGMYPIEGLTKRMVEVACRERTLAKDYCDGDTEDRQQVRLKIVKNYGLVFS